MADLWTTAIEIAVPVLTCGGTAIWHIATTNALVARLRAEIDDLRTEVRKGAASITEATSAVREMIVRADERTKTKQDLLQEAAHQEASRKRTL